MRMPKVSRKQVYSFTVASFEGGINQEPDEQCTSISQSPEAYNVKVENGALSRSSGFGVATKYSSAAGKVLPIPDLPGDGMLMIYREQANETLYVQGAGGLHKEVYDPELDKLTYSTIYAGALSEPSYCVNYTAPNGPYAVVGGIDRDIAQIWSEGLITVPFEPMFYKAVQHYERLFGIGATEQPNRIYFSKQYSLCHFTVSADGGGYIDVYSDYGNAVDIVSFNDCMYVFWQYGITKLRAYSYQADFVLTDCYSSGAEIQRESVQVCGERIVFATKEGVYSFNGESVNKIGGPVSGFFESGVSQNMASGYFRDYYYLALHSSKYEGEGNNVLLRYHMRNAKWEMYAGLCVTKMMNINKGGEEKMIFLGEDKQICSFDESDTFCGRPIHAKWVTPMNTLGQANMIKRTRCILIGAEGSGRLKLTLTSERGSASKYITLSQKRKVYRVPMRVTGQMLSLTIENDDGNPFTAVAPMVVFTAYDCR